MSDFNFTISGGSSKRLLTKGKYCPADIVVTAEGGGGGDSQLDALIDGTITSVSSNATEVRSHKFDGCANLISANFPEAGEIDTYAFSSCTALKSINFPKVTWISNYGFAACTSLTSANFPAVTGISNYVFEGCSNLASVSLPNATSVGAYSFKNCVSLTRVNLAKNTNVDACLFQGCSALVSIDIPATCYEFKNYAFDKCTSLTAVIIRRETYTATARNSIFRSTPVESGTGYIYVPRALLSDTDSTKDYRRATNWSEYGTQFRALEDYTVDGTITGELDPNKI